MSKKQLGFTLIELLTTIAVLAIITTIAVPNITYLITQNRIKTAAYNLNSAISLARSETMRTNGATLFAVLPQNAGTLNDGWCVASVGTTQVPNANTICTSLGIVPNKIFPAPTGINITNNLPSFGSFTFLPNGTLIANTNAPASVPPPVIFTIAPIQPRFGIRNRQITINRFDTMITTL